MASKTLDIIVKEKFKFLESDFGFKLLKSKKKDWGYDIVYINRTTGVKINYEFGEAYLFIMLYKLTDGNLIENPGNIQENTVLYGCGLDDIISIRNPEALIKPAYEYGDESEYYDKNNGLEVYVTAFASNLKEYCSDVLSGDFEIFSGAQKLIRERAKEIK